MAEQRPTMWIMKITPGGSGNTKLYFENLFAKEGCKNLIGYSKEGGKVAEFSGRWNRIKIGDLVVVIEGLNRVFGVVEITSDPFNDDDEIGEKNSDWFYHRRKANLVKYFNPYFEADSNTNQDTLVEYSGDGAIAICDQVWYMIGEEYFETRKRKLMQDKIDILKYKKQIILQGPPGTGKTFHAQKIAKELTKDRTLGSPLAKIDEYFKTHSVADSPIIESRKKLNDYLKDFLTRFPKDKLKDLSLKEYAFGDGNNDSFCWWTEYGLWDFGAKAEQTDHLRPEQSDH